MNKKSMIFIYNIKKAVRFLLAFLTIIFVSCGQDRSGEYYAIVADKQWIEEKMREVYLWYEDIPFQKDLNYLMTPTNFFNSLLTKTGFNNKADNFSTLIPIDTESTRARTYNLLNYTTSYGMQCQLYRSTQNNKYYYALVLYVLPDSPADKAGIKRGDWIGKIDYKEIETSNEELLYTGGAVTIERNSIEITYKEKEKKEEEDEKEKEREIESYKWVPLDTISISAAEKMLQTPYIAQTLIRDPEIGNIGYLAYNSFALQLDDETNLYNDSYINEMIEIFRGFNNVQKFILDLRYNPGGYLVSSHVLASLLVPEESLGELFCSLAHNDKMTSENEEFYLNTNITKGVNLNLKELYVITSDETASASEVLINCLSHYMKIITIGETTVGKNVASKEYKNEEFPSFILAPIVAYVRDVKGETKYVGIKPDFEVKEITAVTDTLHALGGPKEKLLYNTIHVIKNGRLPGTEEEEDKKEVKAASSKRRLNQLEGIILK